MQEIMKLAHEFLQNFCAGNQQNQALLHKHINLFLNPGVRTTSCHFFFSIKKREWIVLGECLWACSDARLVEGVTFYFPSKALKFCLGPFQWRKFKRLKWTEKIALDTSQCVEILGPQKCLVQSWTLQECWLYPDLSVDLVVCLRSNFFVLSPSLDSGSSDNAAHFHEQLPALQWD